MVNITFHFEWTYIKYIITSICVFICATFLSSASVLESATIGIISGIFSFWIDKASMWPNKFMQNIKKTKKQIDSNPKDYETKISQVIKENENKQ
jgi:hypothetical protein